MSGLESLTLISDLWPMVLTRNTRHAVTPLYGSYGVTTLIQLHACGGLQKYLLPRKVGQNYLVTAGHYTHPGTAPVRDCVPELLVQDDSNLMGKVPIFTDTHLSICGAGPT